MNETQEVGTLAPSLEPGSLALTGRQISSLNGVRRLTSTLSIVGSALIIFMILKRRKSTAIRSYNRLLFSISVTDIISSCATFAGMAAIWDVTTCNTQAFIFHWSYISSMLYTSGLMVFFTLTVVYDVSDDTFAARVEPFMHVFAILFPLGTAITALLLDSFNPYLAGCWIHSFPHGCIHLNAKTCIRGEHSDILFMASILAPAYFMTAVMYVSIFLIYQAVKKRERLARQATFGGRRGASELSSSVIMLRTAGTKAIMFATAFFITYIFAMIVGTIEWSGSFNGDEDYFPLVMLAGCLLPCQGFFNFIVYIHPRFMRIRRMRRDKYFLWVLWKAISLEKIEAQPVKCTTRTDGLPGSSQTVRGGHMLHFDFNSGTEMKNQNDITIVNAENELNEAENEHQICQTLDWKVQVDGVSTG